MTDRDKSIAKQVAYEVLALFCNNKGIRLEKKQLKPLADKVYNWIMLSTDKENNIKRQAAMRRAAMLSSYMNPIVAKMEDLIDLAELIYKDI